MKKLFKRKVSSVEEQVQPDMTASIDKIQQQLVMLERKIDSLIAQSSERPFERKEHSRSFQRFDNSFRRDRGGRENSFRERSFTKAICAECNTECEVPFKPTGDRPVYCKDCFAKRKDGGNSFKAKFDRSPRERTPAQDSYFDKSQGRENRSSGGRKKPAFRKRKDRA
ncbi:MAG: CxxC-x17-CxxC domain-containing protein [Candidatus Omnitrophota bacterium]